ncbi:MAG: CPBP family intramembrane metalloprotease [Cytophagales bacterium]|nr:CPBP family intramembrane metalloprotease [Cytophagales bacterium]
MWKSVYLEPIVAISTCIPGFTAYFFIANASLLLNLFEKEVGKENNLAGRVVFQRLTGMLFLGIIPAMIGLTLLSKTPFDFGIKAENSLPTLYWILGLSAIIIPINLVHARKQDNVKIYPQIRAKKWTIKLILINVFTWAAYLFAYEFLFRGFLLFSCMPALGICPAIAINTAIYSLVHIPKGIKETLGAIPFGILLCIITFDTGTIWAAFFIHLILAISNDLIAIYANPAMQFKLRK